MSSGSDIHIRIEGRAGRITLQRPAALNALTHEQVLAMEAALESWRTEDRITAVLLDAEGDRAFCAGGDIERLYETGIAGDFEYGRRFWTDEYRLNALIAEYPKPILSFMQGFVMGGGVGIGCHGSHRIAGETARFAMPECAVGLVPDVGGTYLLARAPRRFGWYLGVTGARIGYADAIFAGLADFHIGEADWPDLKKEICRSGQADAIADAARPVSSPEYEGEFDRIEQCFAAGSALECVKMLEAGSGEWFTKTARTIRRGSAISVACTWELLKLAREAASVRDALANELRFTWRSMTQGEFLEGVRAQIIDKDRQPRWRIASLEDVADDDIRQMLAPVPELDAND